MFVLKQQYDEKIAHMEYTIVWSSHYLQSLSLLIDLLVGAWYPTDNYYLLLAKISFLSINKKAKLLHIRYDI